MKRSIPVFVAEAISNVLSPPAVLAMFCLALAVSPVTAIPLWPALGFFVLYGGLASLIPVMYIVYLLKTKQIGDLHMKRRQDRNRPFVIGVTTALVAWALLALFGAPPYFLRLALFNALLLSVIAVINVWWQISTHGAAIMAVVTISGVIFGLPVAAVVSPLVLVVAWARLYLGRHSVSQIIAGVLLGVLVALAVFVAV